MMSLEPRYLSLLALAGEDAAQSEQMKACFELLSLATAIDQDCAERLGRHGLSEARFILLCILNSEEKGLSPSALADRVGATRATITGLVDGLERDGLARRNADANDRRAVQVHLTPAGVTLAKAILKTHNAWIASLLADLDPDDRQQLGRIARKIWLRTDAGQTSSSLTNQEKN